MTNNATTVAPLDATAARRYDEQIHALVDERTREYLLGLAVIAHQTGAAIRVLEGAVIRDLLDDAIVRAYERDPKSYAKVVRVGRRELATRRAAKADAAARTSKKITDVVDAPAPA